MPLELAPIDFDAFGEGRGRATVKQRLAEWGEVLAERLAAAGIDMEVASTDEHPTARNGHRNDAQSLFLFRGPVARRAMRTAFGSATPQDDDERPYVGHGRLEVRVDALGATLLVWLGADARMDLETAIVTLASPSGEDAWQGLPPTMHVEARSAISTRGRRVEEVTASEAVSLAQGALGSDVPLVVGSRIVRDATPMGLSTWDDDAFALGRWLADVGWSPGRIVRAPESRPSRRPRRPSARKEPVRRAPPEVLIERGMNVRALAGPFSGQSGVVQEVDGKGGARVRFGLLTTRVELGDLAIAVDKRSRVLLSSSHRKPPIAR